MIHYPYYLHIGPLSIHPHFLFEALAYALAFRFYLWLRQHQRDFLPGRQRLWVLAAAAMGAALGSKILFWFCNPALSLANWRHPFYFLSEKTS